MKLPKFISVTQKFPRPCVEDVASTLQQQLTACPLSAKLPPGAQVAITAGSRGIANYALILKTLVQYLHTKQLRPVIIPAMGSHGGATAEGQRAVLAGYGITPENIGAPIISCLDVVSLGKIDGHEVVIDRVAMESDAIIVVNRIKPHTSFHGPVESGLLKMMVIGLGKHQGALQAHATGFGCMSQILQARARLILEKAPIALGIALLENAYEETAQITVLPPQAIERQEPQLLQQARALMPHLPVNQMDLLIVEEIGKNISGTGMDTNIIGRRRIPGLPEPTTPVIKWIVALRLSTASQGNGLGIGLADFTTRRLYHSLDYQSMYANAFTSGCLQRVFLPVILEHDLQAITTALECLKLKRPPRIVRIKNTLELEQCWISESLNATVRSELLQGTPQPLRFDEQGNLLPA